MNGIILVQTLVGWFLVGYGVSLALNPHLFDRYLDDIKAGKGLSPGLLFVMLFFGLWIILQHNIWSGFKAIIVSFIGWSMTIKALIYMMLPNFMASIINKIPYAKAARFGGVFSALLGIVVLVF